MSQNNQTEFHFPLVIPLSHVQYAVQ